MRHIQGTGDLQSGYWRDVSTAAAKVVPASLKGLFFLIAHACSAANSPIPFLLP